MQKWFIVARNEVFGDRVVLKELRVSSAPHSEWTDGPLSGVKIRGVPIEDLEFSSADEAQNAIPIQYSS